MLSADGYDGPQYKSAYRKSTFDHNEHVYEGEPKPEPEELPGYQVRYPDVITKPTTTDDFLPSYVPAVPLESKPVYHAPKTTYQPEYHAPETTKYHVPAEPAYHAPEPTKYHAPERTYDAKPKYSHNSKPKH